MFAITADMGNKMTKPIVIIESPFAGFVKRNKIYARLALRDSLIRGEAPFASHLLYTQDGVLDDRLQDERALGIVAGLRFSDVCDFVAVYNFLDQVGKKKELISAINEQLKKVKYAYLKAHLEGMSQQKRSRVISRRNSERDTVYRPER